MSSSKDTDNESARQQQIDILLKLVVTLTEKCQQPTVCAPAITSDGIYTSEQVIAYIGVSDVTIAQWCEFNGLSRYRPGVSKYLFFGSDLMQFIRAHPNGVIKAKTAKEKNTLRKAAVK